MKKITITQQLTMISEIYRQPVSKELPNIWLTEFESLPDEFLVKAIQDHIRDPDQGRFWPTPAHLYATQIYSDRKIKALAAEDFDENPRIDGADSHQIASENYFDRNQRKRQHIAHDLEEWHEWEVPRKLCFSKSITEEQRDLMITEQKRITEDEI